MAKIVGRSDDMLIIRGVNVFPTQIEALILQHGALSGQYLLHVRRDGPLDQMEVRCEVQPAHAQWSDEAAQRIASELQQHIKVHVGISVTVTVLPPESLERLQAGKARRVTDTRTG
jgi:phenylacetate-CoA ligase